MEAELIKQLFNYGVTGIMLAVVCVFCWRLIKRQDKRDETHREQLEKKDAAQKAERDETRREYLVSLDKRDTAFTERMSELNETLKSVCRHRG